MEPTNNIPHIIFVYPPPFLSTRAHKSEPMGMCLGSAYIISYLTRHGFIARQLLTDEPANIRESTAQILAQKPKTVGFTVNDANYCGCQLIAESIKEVDPNIIILFGGATASVQSEVILKNNDSVDICVRNEGEETCLELLSILDDVHFDLKKACPSFEKVKGITYRIEDKILKNPGRNVFLANKNVTDYLDKYPSPYLSGVVNSSPVGIITARGCNQYCIYCNCSILSKHSIATHSPERVIEELDYISRKKIYRQVLEIYDDAFTLFPDRALAICNKIIENKIKIPLSCTTRCDKVNEELLDKIKEAGFKAVGFSLESAVPRILRVIGKVQHPKTGDDDNFEKEKEFIENLKKYIAYAKKIGIDIVFTSIMVGLPTETLAEGRQTMDFINSISNNIDQYAHNIFHAFPGTPVFSNYEKYGVKLVKSGNQIHYRTINPYDTGKIEMAAKSHFEKDGITLDKTNMKSLALSLSLSKKSNLHYFNKVILCADIIKKNLMLWLQEYLALGGHLIQIYTDFHGAREYYQENKRALLENRVPVSYYNAYYQADGENGAITLTPYRTYLLNKRCGITISLVNNGSAVLSAGTGINPQHSICIDREKEDVRRLYRLLAGFTRENNALSCLIDSPIYPYMSSLCRWENDLANCRCLEIVIVDADDHVKTCWHGTPIGEVGMPLPVMAENLKRIYRETEDRRGCKRCPQESVCSRCIFPGPLSEREYCRLRKNFNTEEPSAIMRAFDLFKEID